MWDKGKIFHTFMFQNLLECIKGAFVNFRVLLDLDTSLYEGEGVQHAPYWEWAQHGQWEKLVFVHHVPFNGANVTPIAVKILHTKWLHGSWSGNKHEGLLITDYNAIILPSVMITLTVTQTLSHIYIYIFKCSKFTDK